MSIKAVPTPQARKAARRVSAARADAWAAALAPVIAEIRASGTTAPYAIAAALTARGIPTARGHRFWMAGPVRSLLNRLDRLSAAGLLGFPEGERGNRAARQAPPWQASAKNIVEPRRVDGSTARTFLAAFAITGRVHRSLARTRETIAGRKQFSSESARDKDAVGRSAGFSIKQAVTFRIISRPWTARTTW